jgi:hypothetical protein
VRSRPGAARTILLCHIISARPSKQARMVGSTLGVYSFGLILVSARTNKRHHHQDAGLDLAECKLIQQPKAPGTMRRSAVNHRGSFSSANTVVTDTQVFSCPPFWGDLADVDWLTLRQPILGNEQQHCILQKKRNT